MTAKEVVEYFKKVRTPIPEEKNYAPQHTPLSVGNVQDV